jgi:hypothetical protein
LSQQSGYKPFCVVDECCEQVVGVDLGVSESRGERLRGLERFLRLWGQT